MEWLLDRMRRVGLKRGGSMRYNNVRLEGIASVQWGEVLGAVTLGLECVVCCAFDDRTTRGTGSDLELQFLGAPRSNVPLLVPPLKLNIARLHIP